MIKRTRRITIGKFMDLWNTIEKKDYRAIVPGLGPAILKEWKDQIIERFYRTKSYGSEGQINFDTLAYLVRQVSNMKEVPEFYLPRIGYNRQYMRQYPITFVKTGELRDEMRGTSWYSVHGPNEKGELGVIVHIPFSSDPDNPDRYEVLETQRSFVKSSFIMAWPKILHAIMEKLMYR